MQTSATRLLGKTYGGCLWGAFGVPWVALGIFLDFDEKRTSFSERRGLKPAACVDNEASWQSHAGCADSTSKYNKPGLEQHIGIQFPSYMYKSSCKYIHIFLGESKFTRIYLYHLYVLYIYIYVVSLPLCIYTYTHL